MMGDKGSIVCIWFSAVSRTDLFAKRKTTLTGSSLSQLNNNDLYFLLLFFSSSTSFRFMSHLRYCIACLIRCASQYYAHFFYFIFFLLFFLDCVICHRKGMRSLPFTVLDTTKLLILINMQRQQPTKTVYAGWLLLTRAERVNVAPYFT